MMANKISIFIAFLMQLFFVVESYSAEKRKNRNRALSQSGLSKLPKPSGDDKCPCIPYDVKNRQVPKVDLSVYLGTNINQTSYGVNCAKHDAKSKKCSNLNNCDSTSLYYEDCRKFGCKNSWCYVDAKNCNLVASESPIYENAHYSSATCGFVDTKKNPYDFNSLKGKTFNVALASNSGGWTGAYNPEGSFASNDLWKGPHLDFVRRAASIGDFTLNYTKPPEWIHNYSKEYFNNSTSSFDYCVYAVALGFLDFCISGFTMTNERTEITPFFETNSRNIYLFIISDPAVSIWQDFKNNLPKIFKPFTVNAWIGIITYLLILGLVMLLFEYNASGSVFPREIPVLSKNRSGESRILMKKVPISKYVAGSLYRSLLAFCEQTYGQSVYTVEGKILLLAVSFLMMMVISLYTANIAALLTTQIQDNRISSIEDAVHQGFNFCANRNVANLITPLYNIDQKLFVPDPIDGRPGYTVKDSRSRAFEFMKKGHSNPSLYCNAAIGYSEDLDVYQNSGKHCDVIRVGEALSHTSVGLPISSKAFPALSSLLHSIRRANFLEKLVEKKPISICKAPSEENNSLTLVNLSGLWVLCTVIVVVAVITKFIRAMHKKMNPLRTRDLERFNQWGEPSSYDIVLDNYVFQKDEHNLRDTLATVINKFDDNELETHDTLATVINKFDDNERETHNEIPIHSHSNDFRRRMTLPKINLSKSIPRN